MLCIAGGLLLGYEAGLVGGLRWIHHIVGDVQAQLDRAAPLARKVLLQCLAAVHKPELPLTALHPLLPAQSEPSPFELATRGTLRWCLHPVLVILKSDLGVG